MALKLTNNAVSTLAASIIASDTAVSVQVADADKFPTLAAGDWFPLTVVAADGSYEIMRCTARAGALLTVSRAQEGTTAIAFDAGARADLRVTAAALGEKLDQAALAGATAKGSLADGDQMILLDSADSNAVKRSLWSTLKSGVWSALGGLIAGGTNKATPVDADMFALADSAASNASRKLTLANLKAAIFSDAAAVRATLEIDTLGVFVKADPYAVAFTKTGAGTISIKAGTVVEVDGSIYAFDTDTAVTMPTLTAGTDYVIWIKPDGTLEATDDFTTAPLPDSRRLGGFHYAPGGNATAYNVGGNATPAINEYSIWDMKFRPACPDPRGMALVAGKFWCDIYLCGVNHHSDGTSRYNVVIADGGTPPKIPSIFGGNGSTAYSTLNWWEAAEVMTSHGKELLSYDEFAAAMYGTVEGTDGGTDPVSTILRDDFTSVWGIMLATGNMWVWGREFSYRQDGAATPWAYRAQTGGRGSLYLYNDLGLVAALFGGYWDNGADAGSRASGWSSYPWHSVTSLGARGRSDHLNHV